MNTTDVIYFGNWEIVQYREHNKKSLNVSLLNINIQYQTLSAAQHSN